MFTKICNRTQNAIKYVCIADTTYVLLLYCLSKTMEEIESTLFVVGIKFPKNILSKLPNSIILEVDLGNNVVDLCMNICKERKLLFEKYPFIKECPLYGLDHITKSYVLLNHRKMVVIEDGYGLYNPPGCKQTLISKVVKNVLGIPLNTFGRGNHCDSIIYTGLMPYHNNGKKLIKIDVQQELCRDKEREIFIYNLYDICKEDIDIFQSKDIIIITQPIEDLGDYSDEDKFRIYGRCLESCDHSKVIIKTHPRDKANYKSIFPDVEVYSKPVPLEILSILSGNFKKAYTHSSTAIFSMPETIEKIFIKDWL